MEIICLLKLGEKAFSIKGLGVSGQYLGCSRSISFPVVPSALGASPYAPSFIHAPCYWCYCQLGSSHLSQLPSSAPCQPPRCQQLLSVWNWKSQDLTSLLDHFWWGVPLVLSHPLPQRRLSQLAFKTLSLCAELSKGHFCTAFTGGLSAVVDPCLYRYAYLMAVIRAFILKVAPGNLVIFNLTKVSVAPLLPSAEQCVPLRWRRQLVLPWCKGSGAGTTHRLRPQPRTRAGDGVARRGAASHPQAGSGQERRGGEEEPAHCVQVGNPHTVLSSWRQGGWNSVCFWRQIC